MSRAGQSGPPDTDRAVCLSLLHTHHVLPAQSLPDPDTFGEAAGGEVKSLHGFKSWLHALDPIA